MTGGGMTSARRRVGVLGGMGPEATVRLMSRVIALTPARDDADHVPLLVDQNPQVPSRIAALLEGGAASESDDPGPVLVRMARGLEAAGAEALAMPCNTAHAWLADIAASVSVPVLDMVALSAARIAADRPGARVGLLASPAVRRTGIYDRALHAAGLAPLHSTREAELLSAIRAVKRGEVGPGVRAALADAAAALMADGADLLLIACTEFSVIADALPDDAPRYDALDLLAEEIVTFATGVRPAPDRLV